MTRASIASITALLLAAGACTGKVETTNTGATGSGGGSTTSATSSTSASTATSGSTSASASTTASTSASAASSSGTGGGMGAPSDVTGTMIYRYYSESAPVDVPVDLQGVQVEAFVWNAGSWTTYPGVGKSDGSFTVPAVPAGLFMLDVGGAYVYTTAHTLDLGGENAGRYGAVMSTGGASIAGAIQNLDPWQANDTVEWFDANAGGAAYGFDMSAPANGDTSIQSQPCSWNGALIDATKGDVLYATQLSASGSSVVTRKVSRYTSFASVEQTDGVATMVSGAFTPVTDDQMINVNFAVSAFAQLGTQVNPIASNEGAFYSLSTAPGMSQAGLVGYYTDLLLVYPTADVNLANVAYANPFSATWGTEVYAGGTFGVQYTAPGATAPAAVYGYVYVTLPSAQAATTTLKPVVTPVVSPLVNGKSAFGPLNGISLTPTLSWSPPAVGAPSGYRILVSLIANSGGTSTSQYLASIFTVETSVPLPPNMLQKGSTYVFTITALSSPIAATKPFHGSPTYAGADVLSSLATP
jgi:hypothetical protein